MGIKGTLRRIKGRLRRFPEQLGSVGHAEHEIADRTLRETPVVFDVGANRGAWSRMVRSLRPEAELHLFEPLPDLAQALADEFPENAVVTTAAAWRAPGEVSFNRLDGRESWSSIFHRAVFTESSGNVRVVEEKVAATSLDAYWAPERGQIDFLRIDVEGAELDVLMGARALLRRGTIDYVQFEYGGTYLDANRRLEEVFFVLHQFGYRIFELSEDEFNEIAQFNRALETYEFRVFLAVNERLCSLFLKQDPVMIPYFEDLTEYGIEPRGVLHIGAHQGKEIELYDRIGAERVAFFEANPDLAAQLRDRFASNPTVDVVERAISESEGRATFNVASSDQSSSLLQFEKHLEMYPTITATDQIEVRTSRLDDCMAEAGLHPLKYNVLAIDVEGAELMALRGAPKALKSIEAIQLEINYTERFKGCAKIWEIDAFLEPLGFLRVKTQTPYHPEWGDALYVRSPRVANPGIGALGRFGNQIFQHAFVHCYADDHGFQGVTNKWIGDDMFAVTPGLPSIPEMPNAALEIPSEPAACAIRNNVGPFVNTAFEGFFQFHTAYYLGHRDRFLREFAFKDAYANAANQLSEWFAELPGLTVALHLRRGDYGYGYFFLAPDQWYLDWLEGLANVHGDVTVYIASDQPKEAVTAFSDYRVVTAADSGIAPMEPGYFLDFAALTVASKVAISNSSFSFAATMLNGNGDEFMRPSLNKRRLIPYDPWAAEVLLKDIRVEDAGLEFMNAAERKRPRYLLKRIRHSLSKR
ncbi:MAG: FkbM family methyltransferase [Pseudomonadota bacterium]